MPTVLLGLIAVSSNNGRALTPPMGWRCWNQYQGRINQRIMESSYRSLASTSDYPAVAGKRISLRDLGYSDAGLDDGWQLCNHNLTEADPYTYHTPPGTGGAPVVDLEIFPDMAAMNALAHSLNLTSGWYGNNCNCGPTPRNGCSDTCDTVECFAGDVNATLFTYGFDSIKLDGCGAQRDIALWEVLFNHSIEVWNAGLPAAVTWPERRLPMMLENCHDGMPPPRPPSAHSTDPGNVPHRDAAGELWCPMHMYRTSGDNRPVWGSILSNLNSTVRYAMQNLSVPGCWAYADMLEVAVTNVQLPSPGKRLNCGKDLEQPCPPLTVIEARSHFAAWSIVSSPLVLGMNLSDSTMMAKHWATITNQRIIEVNQDYAGFSGTVFDASLQQETFTPCDWNWKPDAVNASCTWPSWWSWYKPLSGRDERGSTMAVLLINNGADHRQLGFKYANVPGLGMVNSGCRVFDVYDGTEVTNGVTTEGFTTRRTGGVAPHDSVFVTLSGCT